MPRYVDTEMILVGGYRLIKIFNGGSFALIEHTTTCHRQLYVKLAISRKWLNIAWL